MEGKGKKNNVCHHFSLISHGDARQNKQILTRGGKSQEKLAATTSASARPCLVNQDQFGTCLTRSVSRAGVPQTRVSRFGFLWASTRILASVCATCLRGGWERAQETAGGGGVGGGTGPFTPTLSSGQLGCSRPAAHKEACWGVLASSSKLQRWFANCF